MKKLVIVAVALASVNAFATRARVTALGNSPHLMDTQTVYTNPADMMMMGDYVTMESGATSNATVADCDPLTPGAQPCTTAGTNSEGMMAHTMGAGKVGISLGHQSENASTWGTAAGDTTGLRAAAGFATIKNQQNPIGLFYGAKMSDDSAWGANLIYSNYNDKVAKEKESSAGIRFGYRAGALDAKLGVGLGNTYENTTDGKFKGTLGISAGAGYMMDNNYFSVDVSMSGFKTTNISGATSNDLKYTRVQAGVVNTTKKDGTDMFYGAALAMADYKNKLAAGDLKVSSMSLPIWLGVEADAASWLTLRGSVKQNVLIHSKKVTSGSTTAVEYAPGSNSTAAAVGAGFKFNKLSVDGTLEGLVGSTANQQVNGNKLLATVGMTYMF